MLKIAHEVIFLVFDLDLKLVGVIVAFPGGVPPVLPLGPVLQELLLRVDDQLDSREIGVVLVDIDGDLHPRGLEGVRTKRLLVGIVHHVG